MSKSPNFEVVHLITNNGTITMATVVVVQDCIPSLRLAPQRGPYPEAPILAVIGLVCRYKYHNFKTSLLYCKRNQELVKHATQVEASAYHQVR